MTLFFERGRYTSMNDRKQWLDKFWEKLFYSHGTANFYGNTITFFGSKWLEVFGTERDDQGRILILDKQNRW